MKITALLITLAILQVSAASFAQKINLNEQRASLEQVLDHIRQQTGYNFIYREDILSQTRLVTLNLKDATLEDALKTALDKQSLEYEIDNKTIIIKKAEPNLIDRFREALAQITVTGKVQDESGQPLQGVTVKIKDTNQATITDSKGTFTITAPDEKTILVFSFIGYESLELSAKEITVFGVIKLKAGTTNLQEVIISKGYYSVKQELNTGNVTRITADVIGRQPVSDPILALEGRVPGMYISQTSGLPGASYSVMLRGRNSIQNGNSPLYIVDGVPFTAGSLTSPYIGGGAVGTSGTIQGFTTAGGLSPFNNINPADIESIEVLKDADATAIYGSRGANGVVLITTRKGHAGQSKIDINVSSGIGRVARKLQLLNTDQYLMMRREAFLNDGQPVPSITTNPNDNNYDINGAWDKSRYTDWQKELIGGAAHFTNIHASLSGGDSNTQYVLAGGYSRQTTVFPGEFADQKGTLNVNINHASTNRKFKALFSGQYANDNNLLPNADFTNFINQAPDAPRLYNSDGSLNWEKGTFNNPMSQTLRKAEAITNTFTGNLTLSYELLQGLQISSSFGYNYGEMHQSIQTPAIAYYGPATPSNRQNNFASNYQNSFILEPQINFNRQVGKGTLQILVGSTIQQNVKSALGQSASGFSADAIIPNIAAATSLFIYGSGSYEYRYNGLFGRVGYNVQDKYLLNITARRDGSSRFGPGNQFGNFGAVGAAWIFSKEKFIHETVPFLSLGKIRASYGITGNDQVTDYLFLSTYTPYTTSTYQSVSPLNPSARIYNPQFGWETVKKMEAALELGWLNDRILFTASYYRNRTGNQLVVAPLPAIDGYTDITMNLPAIVQNTGVELELNTVNLRKDHFTWSISANLTIPRNKLVAFPSLSSSVYKSTYVVGQPLFIKPAYRYTGVDATTGLSTFEDVNKDGLINTTYDRQFLKQVSQNYYGFLQNSFTYKSISFDFSIQFVKQTGVNFLNTFGQAGAVNNNQPIYVLDRWKSPGDLTNTQKFSQGAGAAQNALINLLGSDAVVSDASFIRLKNAEISYNISGPWQKRVGLRSARVYLQSQNLFTITGYRGLDPETQGRSLPPLRMISTGIQLGL